MRPRVSDRSSHEPEEPQVPEPEETGRAAGLVRRAAAGRKGWGAETGEGGGLLGGQSVPE